MAESVALVHDTHTDTYSKTIFGFWLYVMTDCVLFATLFATFAVLHNNIYGGPTAKELFSLPYVLAQTMVLLTSSFTCGLAMMAAYSGKKKSVMFWYIITFLLGLAFVTMEVHEFMKFAAEGNSWKRSAFLSSYFTLVGTHGAHVTAGLLWIAVMMAQLWSRGLTMSTLRRLACLSLFWHFLDVVWIFIFTIVYLMGAI